jgi:predicted RNA-binding protein with PIN domain
LKHIIIVDAYNFILSLGDKPTIERHDLWEQARQSLHWRMQRYHRITGHQVILVYDNKTSYASLLYAPTAPVRSGGVSVQFTQAPQEADAWILRRIPRFLAEDRVVKVVSNDRELLQKASQLGAVGVRVAEFCKEEAAALDRSQARQDRVQSLLRRLGVATGRDRVRLLDELEELGYPPESAEVFVSLMDDSDPEVRRHACAALSRIDPELYRDELMFALQDEEPRVTLQALEGVRKVLTQEVKHRLLTLLRQGTTPEVEDSLLSTLLVSDDQETLTALFRFAAHSNRGRLIRRLIELVGTSPTRTRLQALIAAIEEQPVQRAMDIYVKLLDRMLDLKLLGEALKEIRRLEGPPRAVLRRQFLSLGAEDTWSLLEALDAEGVIDEEHIRFLMRCPSRTTASFLLKWKGRVRSPDLKRRLARFFVEQRWHPAKLFVLEQLPALSQEEWKAVADFIVAQSITTAEASEVLRIVAEFPAVALPPLLLLLAKIVREQEILFLEEILLDVVDRLPAEDMARFFGLLSGLRRDMDMQPFFRVFDRASSALRVAILNFLGRRKQRSVIDFLQRHTESEELPIRAAAALGLFNLEPDLGFPALQALLDVCDRELWRRITGEILPRISDAQCAALLARRRDVTAEDLEHCAAALEDRPSGLGNVLLRYWKSYPPEFRALAASWLESYVATLEDEELQGLDAETIELLPSALRSRVDAQLIRSEGPIEIQKVIALVRNPEHPLSEKSALFARLLEDPEGESFFFSELLRSKSSRVRREALKHLPETLSPRQIALAVGSIDEYDDTVLRQVTPLIDRHPQAVLQEAILLDEQLHGQANLDFWMGLVQIGDLLLDWGQGGAPGFGPALEALRRAALAAGDAQKLVLIDLERLRRSFSLELFEETFERCRETGEIAVDLMIEVERVLQDRVAKLGPGSTDLEILPVALRRVLPGPDLSFARTVLRRATLLLRDIRVGLSDAGSGAREEERTLRRLRREQMAEMAEEMLQVLSPYEILPPIAEEVAEFASAAIENLPCSPEALKGFRKFGALARIESGHPERVMEILGELPEDRFTPEHVFLAEALTRRRETWPEALELLRRMPEIVELGSYEALAELLRDPERVEVMGLGRPLPNGLFRCVPRSERVSRDPSLLVLPPGVFFLLEGYANHKLGRWSEAFEAWSGAALFVKMRTEDLADHCQFRSEADPKALSGRIAMRVIVAREMDVRELRRFIRPALATLEQIESNIPSPKLAAQVRAVKACLNALRGEPQDLLRLISEGKLDGPEANRLGVALELRRGDLTRALAIWRRDPAPAELLEIARLVAADPARHADLIPEILDLLPEHGHGGSSEYAVLCVYQGVVEGAIRVYWDRLFWSDPEVYPRRLREGLEAAMGAWAGKSGFAPTFITVLRAGLSDLELPIWLEYGARQFASGEKLNGPQLRALDRALSQQEQERPHLQEQIAAFRREVFPREYLSRRALAAAVDARKPPPPGELRAHLLALVGEPDAAELVSRAYLRTVEEGGDSPFTPEEHLKLRQHAFEHYLRVGDLSRAIQVQQLAEADPVPGQEEAMASSFGFALEAADPRGWPIDLLELLPQLELPTATRRAWLLRMLADSRLPIVERLGGAARWQLRQLRPDTLVRAAVARLRLEAGQSLEAYYTWLWVSRQRPDMVMKDRDLAVVPLAAVNVFMAGDQWRTARRLLDSLQFMRYLQTDTGRLLTAYLAYRLAEREPEGEEKRLRIEAALRGARRLRESRNLAAMAEFIDLNLRLLASTGQSALVVFERWMALHREQKRRWQEAQRILRPDAHHGWGEDGRRVQMDLQRRVGSSWQNLSRALDRARVEISTSVHRHETRELLQEKLQRLESLAAELQQLEQRKRELQQQHGLRELSVSWLRKLVQSLRHESKLHRSEGALDLSHAYDDAIGRLQGIMADD